MLDRGKKCGMRLAAMFLFRPRRSGGIMGSEFRFALFSHLCIRQSALVDGFVADFAVGAPYDGPNQQGAVYIFLGSRDGVVKKASQVGLYRGL